MKRIINEMRLRLPALSVNEAVARTAISAFVADLDPTVEDVCDLRCALSEAVTNCVVHAYRGREGEPGSLIYISARLYDNRAPTRSDSSFRDILRSAMTRSNLNIIAMSNPPIISHQIPAAALHHNGKLQIT